jgi:YD repeat-containing protein
MKTFCLAIIASITLLFIIQSSLFGEEQGAETIISLAFSTFAMDADNLGAVSNSVNLFTGDVNLPLRLISLPGRNGLDVNVSILYSSHVEPLLSKTNLELPTGVLGLGWSFDVEKIIVDHKGTGTRADDDFYLASNGTSNLLVRTGTDTDGSFMYETQNYMFWKIRYYSASEKWIVIKEDGVSWIYGDITGGRVNNVQWGVKWGNWIGNSSIITGQQQFVRAWNLSKISNQGLNEISFEYLNINQYVGSASGQQHTEASYLQKITDVFGRTVEFTYAERSTDFNDFQEPHTEQSEPDAYQELYERKYLDYIDVFSTSHVKLFTVDLTYSSIGTGFLIKRQLVSITQKNPDNQCLPSLKLTYRSSSPNKGALETITYPQGGIVTYTYYESTAIPIPKSHRELLIQRPSSSYGHPHVFVGEDYVVVTWLNPNAGNGTLQVYAYRWEGEWIQKQFNDITNIQVIDQLSNLQTFGIMLEKEFFAIIKRPFQAESSKWFCIYRKDHSKRGEWNQPFEQNVTFGGNNFLCLYASGENFVALLGAERGELYRFTWNGNQWVSLYNSQLDTDDNEDFSLGGTNNYFIIHKYDANPDWIKFYYLDELGSWYSVDVPSGIRFNSVYPASWYLSNNDALAVTYDCSYEYVYRWGEWNQESTTFDKYNFVLMPDGVEIGRADATISSGYYLNTARGYRWDAQDWNDISLTTSLDERIGVGIDFVINRDKSTSGWVERAVFNPNTLSWTIATNSNLYKPWASVFENDYAWYETRTDYNPLVKIFKKNSNGWDEYNVTAWSTHDNGLKLGNNYYVYNDYTPGGTLFIGSRIGFYKDGLWQDNISLNYSEYVDVIGENIIVTRDYEDAQQYSQSFILNYVTDYAAEDEQTDYPAQKIAINDGYSISATYFKYTAASAAFDPSGATAQYNEVEVIPNSSDGVSKPYGSKKYYFFNGLPGAQETLAFPANDSYTNAADYYTMLKGMVYCTKDFDSGGNEKGSTTSYWWASTRNLGLRGKGVYSRVLKTVDTHDNIQVTVTNTYNSTNGMIEKITETNTDNSIRVTLITYAYSKYSDIQSKNILSPVAQKTVYLTSSDYATNARTSAVTTWKYWNSSYWAPERSYIWKYFGTSYNLPTFNAWDTGQTPTSSEWQLTSKIIIMDNYGNALKAEDAKGTVASTKWAYNNRLPIMTTTKGDTGEVGNLNLESSWRSWETGSGTISDVQKFSGKYSAYCNQQYGPSKNFYVAGGVSKTKTYRGEAWIYRIRGTAIMAIDARYANGTPISGSWRGTTISTGTGWQYISVEIPPEAMTLLPTDGYLRFFCGFPDAGNEGYVDDIRFYPIDAAISTTVYDPGSLQSDAQFGNYDFPIFYKYDSFLRPIASLNQDRKVLAATNYFYSRGGSPTDQFDAAKPNYTSAIQPNEGGRFDNFESNTLSEYTESYQVGATSWTISNGRLKASRIWDGYSYYCYQGQTFSDLVIECDIKYENGAQFGGFTIRNSNGTYSGGIHVDVNPDRCGFRNAPRGTGDSSGVSLNVWHHVEIIAIGTKYQLYVDGQLKIYTTDINYTSGYCGFIGPYYSGDIYFDNFTVAAKPSVTLSFADGLGRGFQNQSRDGDFDLVTKTTYNALGKVYKKNKTQKISNTNHGYLSTVPDSSEIFEYCNDVLSRPLRQTHLDGTQIQYAYGSEVFNSYTYRYGQATNENNKISKDYYDKLGNNVGGKAAIGIPGSESQWYSNFDILGNTIRPYPPNYYSPPSGTVAGDWDNAETKYNTLGQTTEDITLDEGTLKQVYDKNGNLRYTQNSLQAANGDFAVYLYDKLNRLILIGEELDDVNWTTTPPKPDSTAYDSLGTEANEWKVRNSYDINYVSGMENWCRGKLTRTRINDDSDYAEEHKTTYVYDKYGNLTEKHLFIDGGTPVTEKIIRHVYDYLGRETQVVYPSGNTVVKKYDKFGRLEKLYTSN